MTLGSADTLGELDELLREPREHAPRRGGRVVGAIALSVVLLLLISVAGFATWMLTASVGEPTMTAAAPTAPTPDAAPIILPAEGTAIVSVAGGESYLGADAATVFREKQPDEPRPIASITKLVTALVILDAFPINGADSGPEVTFTQADFKLYDAYYVQNATVAPMRAGSTMSLREALAIMLVPSASNYADALSTWAFGSSWGFRTAAQNWLSAHGMHQTTVVEPTGLDHANTATARDVLTLGRIAAAHPLIAEITAMTSVAYPDGGVGYNTNTLLGSDGVTGLKTGNLGVGNFGIVYTAQVEAGEAGTLTVVGAALGGRSRDVVNAEVSRLLSGLREGFHTVPVAQAGTSVGSITTPWGSNADVIIPEDVSLFTWSDMPITVTWTPTGATAFDDGAVVGTLTWTNGPQSASSDVIVHGDITPPDVWWRFTHLDQLGRD